MATSPASGGRGETRRQTLSLTEMSTQSTRSPLCSQIVKSGAGLGPQAFSQEPAPPTASPAAVYPWPTRVAAGQAPRGKGGDAGCACPRSPCCPWGAFRWAWSSPWQPFGNSRSRGSGIKEGGCFHDLWDKSHAPQGALTDLPNVMSPLPFAPAVVPTAPGLSGCLGCLGE